MIKLAIVGASSTGKTTLLTRLEEQFKTNPAVAFVHESAREFFLAHPESVSFTLEVQEKILQLALRNEQEIANKNPKIMVTDTSALEVIFYTQVEGDKKGADFLLQELEPYISTYTKFLLMNPNDVRFENDIIRLESKETRDKIHDLLVAFYHKHHLPFELISGTIPERQKRVTDIITNYLHL